MSENGKQRSTSYVILRDVGTTPIPNASQGITYPVGPGRLWSLVEEVEATSSDQALRRFAGQENKPPAGKYVAVPARSWRPVPVVVETKTTVRLG